MASDGPDPLAAVRAAFMDTFDEHSTRDGRCLYFFMPGWYGLQQTKRAMHLIGDYGTFAPDIVGEKLEDIVEADPSAQFCWAREMSVALYVKCEYPEPVQHILETAHPQELSLLDDDDEVVDIQRYEESHEHCFHESGPPTPVEDVPEQDEGYDYVRAWWDND